MIVVSAVEDVINSSILKPGSIIYTAGNASTPQVLLEQLASDLSIKDLSMYSVLLLGRKIKGLFSEQRCQDLTHRVIFNSQATKEAVNNGWAKYHPIHLSEIPRNIRHGIRPDVVFITVAGPDKGGNYSLGTTVEGVYEAVKVAKKKGGIVIAERNKNMPFILGSSIPESKIDYLIDTDYALPSSPVREPDERALKIGQIIAALYIQDGTGDKPGSTLQYGIGEVPEAVTSAIINKGVGDLGIHTELLADAMIRLIKQGIVTNRWKKNVNFAVSSIFLAENKDEYDWLNYNSSIQSRPCNYTNNIFKIAEQPCMVTINSAIGVDLHGNIWADSLDARKIYSGVGGQADFIRGAQYSEGGVAIIAMKSTTQDGIPKIVDRCPAGITTTAIPADQVILVTEYGTFDPRNLSLGERAVGIAHLACPEHRDGLLKIIHENPAFHKPDLALHGGIPGFTSYEKAKTYF
ncbi:MAG: acetyl-CoA hydrolase/transferase family protein [candidate division Zixibacteria bacterium]|nr:acetyl-CoA hydrolase/transferase family protein [candidate division Zixibacteria bacterium]